MASTSTNTNTDTEINTVNVEATNTNTDRGKNAVNDKPSANTKDREVYTKRRDKEVENILKLEPYVFQLANYFFALQAFILAATMNGTTKDPHPRSLKCISSCLPVVLSSLAAAANLVSLWMISEKYVKSLNKVDELECDVLRIWGPDKKAGEQKYERYLKNESCRRNLLYASMFLCCILAFVNIVGMGAMAFLQCWHITEKRTHQFVWE